AKTAGAVAKRERGGQARLRPARRLEVRDDVVGLLDIEPGVRHGCARNDAFGIDHEGADQRLRPDVAAAGKRLRIPESGKRGEAASDNTVQRWSDADFASQTMTASAGSEEVLPAAFGGRSPLAWRRLLRRRGRQCGEATDLNALGVVVMLFRVAHEQKRPAVREDRQASIRQ